MSTNILLRRSAVPGNIPTTAQLNLGELAINTADGKIYFKKYDAGANTETIIDISSNLDAAAILAELLTVDGAGTGLDSDLLDGFEGTYYLDWANFTNTATTVTAGTYGSASEVPVFTVDADGKKMSKYVGNVIAPQQIMNSLLVLILKMNWFVNLGIRILLQS